MPRIPKNRARSELWFRGILSWMYHAGQRVIEAKYLGVKHKLFVLNCSRRFGKTFWLVTKALECALTCKQQFPRIKYVAATQKDLVEFVIPAFQQILATCPEELLPIYAKSEKKFVFPHNGAEIQLVGVDKRPDGGRGNYADLFIFDEAGYIEKLDYLYSSVVAPMTLTRPGARIIMASTPPATPAHPFQKFCEKADEEEAYVLLDIFEAAHLTPKQREEAKRECMTETDWEREYLCRFVVDSNRAIVQERQFRHLEIKEHPRPEYFSHLQRYVCMDLGVKRDLTAVGFGYWEPRIKKFVLEQDAAINGPDLTTIGLRDLVKRHEEELWKGQPVYLRISDNNNPLLLQDLSILHNVNFMATSKDNLHAMVAVLRNFIEQGKLIVHPRCKMTIDAIRHGIWNEKRTEFGRSPKLGHFDHLAMLMYLVRNIDQEHDPIPYNFGIEMRNKFVSPERIAQRKARNENKELRKLVTLNKRR